MSKFIKIHNEDGIVSNYVNLDNVISFDCINDELTMTDGSKYVITSKQQVDKVKDYIQNNLLW